MFTYLRKCYTTLGRLYPGSKPVTIKWYWAEPSASIYPDGHVWEPTYLDRDRYEQPDVVGEIPGAKYRITAGRNPGVLASGEWCGTPEDFAGEGRPPLLPSGRPDFSRVCGCSYRPTIGIGIRRWRRFRGGLALGASFQRRLERGPFSGGLALGGESTEPVLFSRDRRADLALGGESTEPVLFSRDRRADLALGGENTEPTYDTPIIPVPTAGLALTGSCPGFLYDAP